MSTKRLEPSFVEFVPTDLDQGTLYVSMTYATASHLCACGCGERVVTPLGPADWTLRFDGAVSLAPSVGNGQFACGSHYIIRNDTVIWCRPMTATDARATHERDVASRQLLHAPRSRPNFWSRLLVALARRRKRRV